MTNDDLAVDPWFLAAFW